MAASVSHSPLGIVGADALALSLAAQVAARGRRAVLYARPLPPSLKRERGIDLAATPADVACECPVVLTTMTETPALRALLLGSTDRVGLGAEMAPGSALVDFGMKPTRDVQGLAGLMGTRAISVLDAAVLPGASGLPQRVLLGGFPDACDEVAPHLTLFGRVERTGALGSAHALAALLHALALCQRALRAHAIRLGRASGIAPETVAGLPADASANAPGGGEPSGAALALLQRLADERGLSSDMLATARRIAFSDARIS